MNPLQELRAAGQNIWLDFLSRALIHDGTLDRLIDDGIGGVTSNPTIFSKALSESEAYDSAIAQLAEKGARDPVSIFYDLALADIQMAADLLRRRYDETSGDDGYVSFELEAALAHDTRASVTKAKELFDHLAKPNVMIKVPGTLEGVPAVEELTALGVNVNITLLFSVDMYEQVATAYIRGLERRFEAGEPIDGIYSVASFFVSRVDTMVDEMLPENSSLRGKTAVANAKLAYQIFLKQFSGERWNRLEAQGARLQKPLWASTGTKNPEYSDVKYVEELVAPKTVCTMPIETIDRFRDHGKVNGDAVLEGIKEAREVISSLASEGVDLDDVTSRLTTEGIRSFDEDFRKLTSTIQTKLSELESRT
jgi:transaldolase/glucose-6-phosphate isomerase